MDINLYYDIRDLETRLNNIVKLNKLIDWEWKPCGGPEGCKTWSREPSKNSFYCDARCSWVPCKPYVEWCVDCGSQRVIHVDDCWWMQRVDDSKKSADPITGYENHFRAQSN